jgi:DNA-binding response OmpR family regulator
MMLSEPNSSPLRGKKVLLVEDNFLFASAVSRMLTELGCTIIGPHAEVKEATQMAELQHPDFALLDITIIGGTSAPVAYRLRQSSTPFIFITGHSDLNMLPDDLRGAHRLSKPFDTSALEAAMLAEEPD